jgi:Na+/H+-dicarboxylate symporter
MTSSSTPSAANPKPRMSLSTIIFLAMGLGVVTGLFFGEMVGFMGVIGDVWIKLLQMTVLPYVMLSLIAGLGRLNYTEALLLAKKGGIMLLLLWAVTLTVIFLFPFVFPDWDSSSIFSNLNGQPKREVDFVSIYIPANPFYALANNRVPAVVLFSIAIGVALIGVEKKHTALDAMFLMIGTLVRIADFVVKLTPIGVFAIMASAAGTLSFAEFQRLEVYIYSYIAVSLVMSFWILPGLVTTFTPLRYKDVVGSTKDALVTAFATSSLFVVLPILMEKSKEMVLRYAENKQEAESAVEVIVPASFNFPHAGKLFTLTFVLFAGWYSGYPIAYNDYPKLVGVGLASLFANVNLAIPFLLDSMQLPEDLYQLFVTTGVINARFATLLAAMFTLTLTLLGAFSMSGLIKISWTGVVRYILVSVLLLSLCIIGVRMIIVRTMENTYDKDQVMAGMPLLDDHAPAKLFLQPALANIESTTGNRLEDLLERGSLRICYAADDIPFSYFNQKGKLVGLDVELFHYLAADLNVALEFVPSNWIDIIEKLNSGYCDMGTGRTMTPGGALSGAFTIPIMNRTVAFLVKDHKRQDFVTFESVQKIQNVKIGIAPNRYYGKVLQKRLPGVDLHEVESLEPYVGKDSEQFNALVTTAEKAAAWSLLYPQYSAVIPEPDPIQIPAGFPLPHQEEGLADYMKIWLTIRKQDGTVQHLYDYWVLGKQTKAHKHRWSVIRDVLHWVQ